MWFRRKKRPKVVIKYIDKRKNTYNDTSSWEDLSIMEKIATILFPVLLIYTDYAILNLIFNFNWYLDIFLAVLSAAILIKLLDMLTDRMLGTD